MNKKRIIIVVILIILMVATFSYFYIKNYIKCNGNNCMGKPTKCEEAYKCELKKDNIYNCHYCDGEFDSDFICNGKEEIIECKKSY